MKQNPITLVILILSSFFSTANAQWLQQPFPTNENLWKVRFVNATTGWVLGSGHVYKTTDAGGNWIAQDSIITGGGTALTCLNSNVAFYAEFRGNPGTPFRGIRKTTDGGTTWRTVDTLRAWIFDIEFVNQHVGFAAGGDYRQQNSCIIRKTTDNGESWFTTVALDAGTDFEAVSFVDSLRGWALSYQDGLVFHTTDGGTSWTFQDSVGGNYPMRDILFATPDSGWAIGGIAGTSVIARTTNGGNSWMIDQGIFGTLEEVTMRNSQLGWIIGRGYNVPPLRTTDSGVNWNEQTIDPPVFAFDVYSIDMVDQNLGWLVGMGGRAYKTINGGVVDVTEHPIFPGDIHLDQNFPNPFNPSTHIGFDLSEHSYVTLSVFDVLGRKVTELENRYLDAGFHSATWDAIDFPSGVYFARLIVSDETGHLRFTKTNKLLLMK